MTNGAKIFVVQLTLFLVLVLLVALIASSLSFEGVSFRAQCKNVPGGDICNGTLYF